MVVKLNFLIFSFGASRFQIPLLNPEIAVSIMGYQFCG
jgi:hypothetical protein